MKKTSLFMLFLVAIVCSMAILTSSFKASADAPKSIDEKVNDLLSQLTLDEKLLLLIGDSSGFDTKAIERLGIPPIRIADGPLGVRHGKATAFPAGVAMAATWDTLLMRDVAAAMGKETKAKGRDYLLGPCVGIHRFPIGGRNFESYSEDPLLATRMGVNWINGVQGENVIASVKHFAMNDQEWERHNVDIIADERAMREIHLPAFEAAVKEANVWTVMAAYNLVNGQHCTENYMLLNDILKKEWGFKGFVISDWTSVYSTRHAANAGLDLEMPMGIYFSKDSLMNYIKTGIVTEETINDKVRRLLRVRFEAGLFNPKIEPDTTVLHGDAHKQLALKSAQEAIVLLKNDNILPLNISKIKTIAVIGPNAKEAAVGGGGSSRVNPYYSVSPLEGIIKRAGSNIKVVYSAGDEVKRPTMDPIKSKYFLTPDKSANGLQAEFYQNDSLAGEPVKVRIDTVLDFNVRRHMPKEMKRTHFSVRWSGWIKPNETKNYNFIINSDDGVRLFINDKLLLDVWSKHSFSTDTVTTHLEAGVEYKIRLEYNQIFGFAMAQLGWNHDRPAEKTNMIEEAVTVAKGADIAIVFAGNSALLESEGRDLKSMDLPGKQDELIKAIAAVNPNTIVVLNGGTVMKVDKWLNNVKGLVDMFYAGQETGTAIASILFGDVNPSGKLPFSFIKDESQSPAYNGYMDKSLKVPYSEGIFVGYRYYDKNNIIPLYPFGFGLSYTTFEYSNVKIKDLGNQNYEVTASIKNTGKVKGDEIAQLYLSDKDCSVPRPVKELKGFSRVSLAPGEVKIVSMKLNSRDFAFWDVNSKNWKVEPGIFEVLIGSSSRDIKLKGEILIK
jgi:beta-glucosidase